MSRIRSRSQAARLMALSVPLLLIAVACSSGDDDTTAAANDAAEAAPAETTAATEAPATEAPADDGTQDGEAFTPPDFGSGSAKIVLFDQTFEFDIKPGTGLCRNVFGIIQAGGTYTDADGVNIDAEFMIPPLDWESFDDGRYDPPSVQLEIEQGDNIGRWTADAGDEFATEGSSLVDAYAKEGQTASGTGTFANAWNREMESVSGSWEVSCIES